MKKIQGKYFVLNLYQFTTLIFQIILFHGNSTDVNSIEIYFLFKVKVFEKFLLKFRENFSKFLFFFNFTKNYFISLKTFSHISMLISIAIISSLN